jgi:hypothetical protein
MSFSEDDYARVRPFLYHLTAQENVSRLRQLRELQSAATLLRLADRAQSVTHPRPEHLPIEVRGERVILRDQAPLHEGNIQFSDGGSFPDFVQYLNQHVFFWSGWRMQPSDYGRRHFQHYSSERPVILRAPFLSIRKRNPLSRPLFCKYNSGSPRWSHGRPSPRGPDTFSPAENSTFTPGDVVEVVFRDSIALPDDTQYARALTGPWRPLWEADIAY